MATIFSLSSIVALKPDTGEYVWHYQETPGEMWDYTASQQITLADISIDGQVRKVLLHAPKNGFFYVLDRATGALISAQAIHVCQLGHRHRHEDRSPHRNSDCAIPRQRSGAGCPGPLGAHSWQPMSYSPLDGLVYIPVNETGFKYKAPEHFVAKKLAPNYGVDVVAAGMPQDPKIKKAILDTVKGSLVAWDPVQQKNAWSLERPGPWNGGVFSTAGNLVFEGTAAGNFEAYRADTGEKVWSFAAQTGVMAGPVTYTVNGEQYVAVVAGWGGVFPLATGEVSFRSGKVRNVSRVLVFKLGGKASLPPLPEVEEPVLNPPPSTANVATLKAGEQLFQRYCAECHGDVAVSGGVLPDLRYSSTLANDQWFYIVLGGLLKSNGMVSFSSELSRRDAADIRSYVTFRANQSKQEAIAAHHK